jgi:uncharacterized protein (DUF952 family)
MKPSSGFDFKERSVRRIYHLVVPAAWEANPGADYRTVSLDAEGFIHCSNADQVERSANRFYAAAAELALLHIDPRLLTSPLLDEPAASGELFPHVHGPINHSAVVHIESLRRGPDGRWQFVVEQA